VRTPILDTLRLQVTHPRGVSPYRPPASHEIPINDLGAFTTALLQQQPAAAVVVDVPDDSRLTSYHLPCVPQGMWFIHAAGVAATTDPETTDPEPSPRKTMLVGVHHPAPVTRELLDHAAIVLRARRMTDPPVLLALPDLEPTPQAQPVTLRSSM
jgi:AraC family transcriptional regulator